VQLQNQSYLDPLDGKMKTKLANVTVPVLLKSQFSKMNQEIMGVVRFTAIHTNSKKCDGP